MSLTKVSKIIESFEKAKSVIATAPVCKRFGPRQKIHASSALLNGAHEEEKEEIAVVGTVVPEEKGDEEVKSDEEGKNEEQTGGDEEAKTEAAAVSTTKQLTSFEKYQRLAGTIDAFTATLGSFDSSNFVYAERIPPFQYELEDLHTSLGVSWTP